MSNKLKIENINEENEQYSDDSLYNIISFGSDMSLRQIVDMYAEGDIEKPDLQRKYVWNKNEASRFIDSVLLGLPVPSVFLAKTKDNRLLIVDGYQRIMTVYDFIHGIFSGDNKLFKLSNNESINSKWRGKTFEDLPNELKRALRMYTIHAIIFEQKHPGDDTAMFQIFERINTGGRVLKPQEIRNCVYHGNFNNFLTGLNKEKCWREILSQDKEDARMQDIELILRFFAFNDFSNMDEKNSYQINLTKYLNRYMSLKKDANTETLESMKKDFVNTITFLNNNIPDNKCFRTCKIKDNKRKWSTKLNPVIFESICYATNYALNNKLVNENDSQLFDKYVKLITDETFLALCSQRTTNVENIKDRHKLALDTLYGEHNDGR